jgi:hypothetical protein
MLSTASLHRRFWASTACYLIHRSPSIAIEKKANEMVRFPKQIIQNREVLVVLPMLMLITKNEILELLSASFLFPNQVLKDINCEFLK